jgi:hypothetical protein
MAIVRLEGLGKPKNPMISSGIETGTFRVVEEYLNQQRYRVPRYARAVAGKFMLCEP